MTPYYTDESATLYLGDALATLRALPDGSADCCVTSPPYYGLRDYGVDGQYGLEASPQEYVERMVGVFAEVRRVLSQAGTLWLNLGDSYAAPRRGPDGSSSGLTNGAQIRVPGPSATFDVPAKNLLGMPWRVALALQGDGWVLRNAIVWHKPNAMPESVTDRLAANYELIFLLSPNPRYWFDLDAVREPLLHPDALDGTRVFGGVNKGASGGVGASARRRGINRDGAARPGENREQGDDHDAASPRGRNPGSVWSIATQPYPEAHFATFPIDLARRCVVAGCPSEVCAVCGEPRRRVTETEQVGTGRVTNGPRSIDRRHEDYGTAGFTTRTVAAHRTVGWSDCGHGAYRPGSVIDPFSGSGTTGVSARMLGRSYVGIDLNPAYHDLAVKRFAQGVLTEGGAA